MLTLSLVVIGAVLAAYAGLRGERLKPIYRALRAFEQAATFTGGKYVPGRVPRVEARLFGVDAVARLHGVDPSEPRRVETEVLAAAPGAPLVLIVPRGVASRFDAALGGQDILTGEHRFDERFMVRAADAGLARAWLHARVRQALLAAGEYGFELLQERLVASRLSPETDPWRLDDAMVAAARLSRAGADLYEAWAAIAAELGALLPGAQAWPVNGLVFDFLVLGTPLRVECIRLPPERAEWQTRVLAPATGRELPAALRAELEGIEGEAGLEGAGVFVRWAGIEPERQRLMRAVSLISAWAGARGSAAYR